MEKQIHLKQSTGQENTNGTANSYVVGKNPVERLRLNNNDLRINY